MSDVLTMSLSLMADTSGAVTAMREYVVPTIRTLSAIAAIASVFFIVHGGYMYMTSAGKPEALEQAKRILKNALLGLVIVIAALTITSILTHAYGSNEMNQNAALPALEAIPQNDVNNGLIDILIRAVIGFLNNIIQAVAAPFLAALDFFTQGTPLMAENRSVFNLWLAMVAIADVLFALVLALIGFHVMSAASFGFDEIEFKHLLPRIALIFLLANTSIFFIDGVIELSNALITAVGKVSGASSVWAVLSLIVQESGSQGVAGLLMMLAFTIFAVFLLVFYVGRIVTLFIGAVMSPLVVLLWLIPGFRDFSETAFKTYLTTIFVLFVHVVILQLSASLFVGMSVTSGNDIPDTLMSMVLGLATVMVLLKTQSVMMQFSYVSMGARNTRKLGGQFMRGVSYMTGKGSAAVSSVRGKTDSVQKSRAINRVESRANITGKPQSETIRSKRSGAEITMTAKPADKPKDAKTGTTYEAPKATPRPNITQAKSTAPKNNSKDKTT